MSLFGSLFGTTQKTSEDVKTVLDMVTYVAGLASNRQMVDPLLDPVRSITANLTPGQMPSPDDTKTLLGIYLKIEAYLITKEPIRAFTKEELRNHLTPQLRDQITAYETNHKE